MRTTKETYAELLDLSLRLTREYDDRPAGSVLRTVARASVGARRTHCPEERLPEMVEARARLMLAGR